MKHLYFLLVGKLKADGLNVGLFIIFAFFFFFFFYSLSTLWFALFLSLSYTFLLTWDELFSFFPFFLFPFSFYFLSNLCFVCVVQEIV